MIQVKVPARICLLGDHQDYLGLPVIAASIDRYLTLEAVAQEKACFSFDLLDLKQTLELPLQLDEALVQKGDFLGASLAVLRRKNIYPNQGYAIRISSEIPVNAGVSSSSALVVAFIRFLVQAFANAEISSKQIADWANEAEVDFFGDPGGIMDHYSIALEDLRVIYPESRSTSILKRPSEMHLILVESGIAKQTVGVLSEAKEKALEALAFVQSINPQLNYQQAKPSDIAAYQSLMPPALFTYWQAAIANHHITQKAIALLTQPNTTGLISDLARLVNEHQGYLQIAIQNTPIKMQQQMRAAVDAGAIATKVIGSGGGGCFFVLADPALEQQVIESVLEQGVLAAYPVNITP